MTRAQENVVDRLALTHGRVAVHDGYHDHAIRVTAPNGAHWIVGEGGHARDAGVNFSIDWTT
jgi:hypothetical protein